MPATRELVTNGYPEITPYSPENDRRAEKKKGRVS